MWRSRCDVKKWLRAAVTGAKPWSVQVLERVRCRCESSVKTLPSHLVQYRSRIIVQSDRRSVHGSLSPIHSTLPRWLSAPCHDVSQSFRRNACATPCSSGQSLSLPVSVCLRFPSSSGTGALLVVWRVAPRLVFADKLPRKQQQQQQQRLRTHGNTRN